jgi:thioredoxin-like negative regulator of GroEL
LNKQQIILVSSGALLFCVIYFFGNTIPPKNSPGEVAAAVDSNAVTINSILTASRQQLTASQQSKVSMLEAAVVRGDVKEQQIKVYHQLAAFWRDSAHLLIPATWYTGEAAKLENSEKNLTFAAHLYLDGVRKIEEPGLRKWMALQAKELFEKSLQLNPNNDSSKVGLGSCYLFGGISPAPMQGIALIREVADRDPNNMYAQFTLGLGSLMSGQLDKATERLLKVAQNEPGNLEAILLLAESYERKGEKENAVKWYTASKKLIRNPEAIKDIDDRIKTLVTN